MHKLFPRTSQRSTMAHTTFFLVTLLGCLSIGLGDNRRGDSSLLDELDDLKALVKSIEAKINENGTKDGDLKALETRLNATEKELEKVKSEVQLLRKEIQEGPKVAFSASLAASGEIYQDHSDASPNLVYKRIFTNIGNAYDCNKGSFTAPVKGVYLFSFSTFGYSDHLSGAILTKNGEHMVCSYDAASSGDANDTGGNTVILQLEKGEQITMRLWEKSQVFDNLNGHTTFSGFLLFPL